MENPAAPESRAERIARYKAERRRELDLLYSANEEDVSTKCFKKDKEGCGMLRDSTRSDRGHSRGVNGVEKTSGNANVEDNEESKISNGYEPEDKDGKTNQNR